MHLVFLKVRLCWGPNIQVRVCWVLTLIVVAIFLGRGLAVEKLLKLAEVHWGHPFAWIENYSLVDQLLEVPVEHGKDFLGLDPEHLLDVILIFIVFELFDYYVEFATAKSLIKQWSYFFFFESSISTLWYVLVNVTLRKRTLLSGGTPYESPRSKGFKTAFSTIEESDGLVVLLWYLCGYCD